MHPHRVGELFQDFCLEFTGAELFLAEEGKHVALDHLMVSLAHHTQLAHDAPATK